VCRLQFRRHLFGKRLRRVLLTSCFALDQAFDICRQHMPQFKRADPSAEGHQDNRSPYERESKAREMERCLNGPYLGRRPAIARSLWQHLQSAGVTRECTANSPVVVDDCDALVISGRPSGGKRRRHSRKTIRLAVPARHQPVQSSHVLFGSYPQPSIVRHLSIIPLAKARRLTSLAPAEPQYG